MRSRALWSGLSLMAVLSACGQAGSGRAARDVSPASPALTQVATSGVPSSAPSPSAVATPGSAAPTPSLAATTPTQPSAAPSTLNALLLNASPPPDVHFTSAIAATAVDARTVAVMSETCDKGRCQRKVSVGGPGAWRVSVVDRYVWGTMAGISGLVALDAGRIFAYGHSGIFRSTDGGQTWQPTPFRRPVSQAIVAGPGLWVVCSQCGKGGAPRPDVVLAVDARGQSGPTLLTAQGITQIVAAHGRGYVLTSSYYVRGSLYVSSDGHTWRRTGMPGGVEQPGHPLTTVDGVHLTFLAIAEPGAGSQDKVAYASPDGGSSWTRQGVPEASGYATNVVQPAPQLLWRYGSRAPLYRSTDGGHTWQVELNPEIGQGPQQLTTMAADGQSAWVLVWNGDRQTSDLYESLDGGVHWRLRQLPVS